MYKGIFYNFTYIEMTLLVFVWMISTEATAANEVCSVLVHENFLLKQELF
jgi:hypothetical protein